MRGALAIVLLAGAGCQQIFGLDAPILRDATVTDGAIGDALDGMPDTPVSPPSVHYVTVISSAVDTSMFSFADVSTGTPASDRLLIVVAHGRNPSAGFGASSLTIDGVTATKLIGVNEDVGAASTAIFTLPAPNGTSATMVLSYAAGAGDRRAALGVWAAYGLASNTPHMTMAASTVTSTPVQAMIEIPAGGFAIAGVSMSSVLADTTSTWTGVTESYDQIVDTSSFSAGANLTPSAGGQVTIGHSSTDTTTSEYMALATFR